MLIRCGALFLFCAAAISGATPQSPLERANGATPRILYVTATYGFRHTDSIERSALVFQELAKQSGAFQIDRTEDVSLLNSANLRNYDALYFFTSGELPLSDQQKADILDFVRQGKGFGGSHSATDCNYTWADYGDLIGGYFDGHPWTQEASVDVEDPQSPLVKHAAPSFRFTEELYQFRAFSRDRVRVLLTLDTRSVDLAAPGINRTDGDFPLAWIRTYGKGRVFYSAFGHFSESYTQEPVRTMLLQALLWLTGQIDLDATPRSGSMAAAPAIAANGVRDAAGGSGSVAPGSIVVVTGDRLTSGSSWDAAATPLPVRLAGTHVEVNGIPAPLFSVRPERLVLQLPISLTPGQAASLRVSSVNAAAPDSSLSVAEAAPAIVGAVRSGEAVVVYVTGLGATSPPVAAGLAAPTVPLAQTVVLPSVSVSGQAATVFFSGLVPGLVGLYQINALPPEGLQAAAAIVVTSGGKASAPFLLEH